MDDLSFISSLLLLPLSTLSAPSLGGQGPLEFCTNTEDREEVTNIEAFYVLRPARHLKAQSARFPTWPYYVIISSETLTSGEQN